MNISPIAAAPAAARASSAAATHLRFGDVLRSRAPGPAPASPSSQAPGLASLGGLERARQRLDRVLSAARSGQTFTPQELLALQADAYRFAQTVEVASRVVEGGVQSVRQAVNTQV